MRGSRSAAEAAFLLPWGARPLAIVEIFALGGLLRAPELAGGKA